MITNRRLILSLIAVTVAALAISCGPKEEPLTAEAIVAMVESGTPIGEVLAKVTASSQTYAMNDDQIAKLRAKGVTDEQIKEITGTMPEPVAVEEPPPAEVKPAAATEKPATAAEEPAAEEKPVVKVPESLPDKDAERQPKETMKPVAVPTSLPDKGK